MIKDVVLEIFGEAWPMMVIFAIILSSIRIAYLVINKEKFILYKELSSLLFIIYISSLFYIVTFQDNNYGISNVIPFKEIFRYSLESKEFFKNVIGNILLYMPFGLFVSAHLNNKKVFPTLFLTIVASITIETVQLVIGRVFDVDDIILNVVGGTLGAYIFIILDKFRGRLPRILRKEWFMNLIVIILLLMGILYFTNLSNYIYGMVK